MNGLTEVITAKITADITDFSTKMDKVSGQFDDLAKKSNEISGLLQSSGKKMMAGGLAIGGGLLYATKEAGTFEEKMSKVQAISSSTQKEMGEISKKAREMGKDTRFSAHEVGDAYTYMAMAGWGAEEMNNAIAHALNLATASGEDLANVTDIVTDGMTAFGMESAEAGRFADVLSAGVTGANMTVGMMGESFTYVGSTAGAFGYSIEDVTHNLGLMANAGVKGSVAGTSLATAMGEFNKTGSKADEQLKEWGISMKNADGSMRDWGDVIGDIREKMSGMTEDQKYNTLVNMVGKEAVKGMLPIINATSEEYDELAESIGNSTGLSQEMADLMNDNLVGSFESMKSALGEMAISLGEHLIPIVREVIEKITEWVQKFNDLDDSTKETIAKIGGLVAIIGTVVGALFVFLGALAPVLSTISTLASVAGTLATAIGTALSGAITVLAGAFALLVSPIGLVVAGLTLLAGGILFELWRGAEDGLPPLRDLKEGMEDLDESTMEFLDNIQGFSDLVDEQMSEAFIGGKEVTDEFANDVVRNFNRMTHDIKNNLKNAYDENIQDLEEYAEESNVITEEMLERIKEAEKEAHEEKVEDIEAMNERVAEIMNNAKEKGVKLTEDEMQEIKELRDEIAKHGVESTDASAEEQLEILDRLKARSGRMTAEMTSEAIKDAEERRVGMIGEAEKEYRERVEMAEYSFKELGAIDEQEYKQLLAEAEKFKKDKVKKAEEMHEETVDIAMKSAGEYGKYVDEETGRILTKWDFFKERVSDFTHDFTSSFTQGALEFWDMLVFVYDSIIDFFEGLPEKISNFLTLVGDKFSQWGDDIKEWYDNFKNDSLDKLTTFKDDVVKKFDDTWNDTVDGVKGFAEDMKQGAIDTIQGMIDGFTTKFQELFGLSDEQLAELKGLFEDFSLFEIGKNIIGGIIKGFKAKWEDLKESVMETGRKIKGWFGEVMDINSPSRVMAEQGEFVGEGIAVGISNTEDLNRQAMVKMGEAIVEEQKKTNEKVEKEEESSGSKLEKLKKKNAETIEKMEKEHKKKVAEIKEKNEFGSHKQIEEMEKAHQSKLKELKKGQAEEEKSFVEKKGKIIKEAEEKVQGTRLKALEQFIADKKSTGEMSNKQEAELIKNNIEKFEKGTEERIKLQERYNKAVEDARKDDLNSMNHYVEMQKTFHDMTDYQEAMYWKSRLKHFEYGSEEYLKVGQNFNKAMENHYKSQFDIIRKSIDEKKALGQITAGEEANIWSSNINSFKKGSDEYIKVLQERAKAIEEERKRTFDNIQKSISTSVALGEMNSRDEAIAWRNQMNTFERGSDEYLKIAENFNKAMENHYKERVNQYELFIREKKALNQMDSMGEANVWKQAIGEFEQGSEEYVKALENHKKALENHYKEVYDELSRFAEQQKSLGRMSSQQEIAYWNNNISHFVQGSDEYIKVIQNRNKAIEDARKEAFANIEREISMRKNLGDMTSSLEAQIWKNSIERFEQGTDERLKAEENYTKALAQVVKDRLKEMEDTVKEEKLLGNMSSGGEVLFWKTRINSFKKGSEEYLKVLEYHEKAVEDHYKKVFDDTQKRITYMKQTGTLSSQREARYWKEATQTLRMGSEEYGKAMENYRKAVEEGRKKEEQDFERWVKLKRVEGSITAEEELKIWKRRVNSVERGSDSYFKVMDNISKLEETIEKERFESMNRHVEEMRRLGRMDYAQEKAYWEDKVKAFEEGTENYKKVVDVLSKLQKDRYDKLQETVEDNKRIGQMNIKREKEYWTKMIKEFEYGTEEYKKIADRLVSIEREIQADLFKERERELKRRKQVNGVSLKGEALYWKNAKDLFVVGSDEYKEAVRRSTDALKKEYDTRLAVLDKFNKDSLKLDEDRMKKEEEQFQKYEESIQARKEKLMGGFSVFDEIEFDLTPNEELPAFDFVGNTKKQLDAIKEWGNVVDELTEKFADEEGIMKEVLNTNYKDLDYLRAMNNLTEDEVDEFKHYYYNLQDQAGKIAERQSFYEKDELAQNIQNIRNEYEEGLVDLYDIILDSLKADDSMKEDIFNSYEEVGEALIEGLYKGMDGREDIGGLLMSAMLKNIEDEIADLTNLSENRKNLFSYNYSGVDDRLGYFDNKLHGFAGQEDVRVDNIYVTIDAQTIRDMQDTREFFRKIETEISRR